MSDLLFPLSSVQRTWKDNLADRAIGGYQRYLSPYKGFSCAYRVLNEEQGASSCSSFARLMIAEKGLNAALPLIRERFGDCGQAHQTLRAQKVRRMEAERPPPLEGELIEENSAPKRGGIARSSSRRNQVAGTTVVNRGGGCDALDCGFLSCEAIECGACACDGLDLGGCACASLSTFLLVLISL